MTRNVIAPSKRSDATVPVEFSFMDQLAFGELISGQVVTCSVFTGADANPSAILDGAPTANGTVVTQVITAGVPGVIYQLVALVNTTASNIYSKSAMLAIVDTPEAFYATS